jgi:DNA polymerase III epsilon subunit-like protein
MPQTTIFFDIETTGLTENDMVTVVCTEQYENGVCKVFNFAKAKTNEELGRLRDELILEFDNATALCAYNGVRFDLPFMQRALAIPVETVTQWVLKTSDILEQLRLRDNATCKLDYLCTLNGVPSKSSSGLEAIRMASEGRWAELEQYCANDVRIMCDLYRKRFLKHPTRRDASIDLFDYVPPGFYDI